MTAAYSMMNTGICRACSSARVRPVRNTAVTLVVVICAVLLRITLQAA